MNRSHRIELRLLLTCFYIYLNCQTFLYAKQVIFHSSLLSTPVTHSHIYIHIRTIGDSCIVLICRCLLLHALWRKIVDLLLISIVLLATLTCIRLIFDCYGYSMGYIKQSLYYPFDSLDTNSRMTEEIIDLIFALIRNCLELIFSTYLFIDITNDHKPSPSTGERHDQLSLSQ